MSVDADRGQGPRPVRLTAFCGATAWGGAEVVLGHLLGSLPSHVRPQLLGVDRAVLDRVAASRPGLPVVVVPAVRGKRDVGAMWAQRRALAATRPDVVQVNLPVPFVEPYTVLAALTLPRARVVAVEHLPMPTPYPRVAQLLRLTTPRLAAHVAVSAAAARDVERFGGLPAGSVRVVRNGVPPPAGPPAAPLATGTFVIGAVGRLEEQKGFDVLLRALVELPAAHLVVLGSGGEGPALGRLADELGLRSRVTFGGWVARPTEQLPNFDVLAVPSRHEGLPLVVLEAMAAGVPVVAADVGGIGEAVSDGGTGLLVRPDDVAGLAYALRRLAADPQLAGRLAAAGRARAEEEFTAEAMARRYAALYAELLG